MTKIDTILQGILKDSAQEAIALHTQYLYSKKISQAQFDRYVAKIRQNTGVKA